MMKKKLYVADIPRLVEEWDYDNNKLSPTDYAAQSNKKVHWVCSKGHRWSSTILNRYYGSGCPYCAGRKSCIENCLITVNPVLAKEWHTVKNGELNPYMVTRGSRKKVWWKCEVGHEWEAAVKRRTAGIGCPYCSNQKVCEDNCLQTTNPELAFEWHPTKNKNLNPTMITYGNDKKVWWKCSKGHEWQEKTLSRSQGCNCPYCSGKRVCKDNCLATLNSTLAKEWHPTKNGSLTPNDVTCGSNMMVWWKCKIGHEGETRVYNRNNNQECPICSGGAVSKISQQWLDSLNIPAENREVWLGKLSFRVDGFDPETKTVYEFLGDYWHGNPAKFQASDMNQRVKKSFEFFGWKKKVIR
jgi:hypothetical protein